MDANNRIDGQGMREMQRRVFAERGRQYLLLKAPTGSGKSRAVMFVALDKMAHQGIQRVLIAVPEKSIGQSFASTALPGFGADWEVREGSNLCVGSSTGKAQQVIDFLGGADGGGRVVVCAQATLRNVYARLGAAAFDGTLLVIDEFHHSSAGNNNIGRIVEGVMLGSSAHIMAMTGTFFRGDGDAILSPENEAQFTPVVYTHREQMDCHEHTKAVLVSHSFYRGSWIDGIGGSIDGKKTLIHIPPVASREGTGQGIGKTEGVDAILDAIGTIVDCDEHGIMTLLNRSGRLVRVADLVDDSDEVARGRILDYLGRVARFDRDAVDVIIALGMAKEGFDWPYCEHALTVGYRSSLQEVMQIVGRTVRDCAGKPTSLFTNLVAHPTESRETITEYVNESLKAIAVSLLMRQAYAPTYSFKPRVGNDDALVPGDMTVRVGGIVDAPTKRAQREQLDIGGLIASFCQENEYANVRKAIARSDGQATNQVDVRSFLERRYPAMDAAEIEYLRQRMVLSLNVSPDKTVRGEGGQLFLPLGGNLIDLRELHIDLIDRENEMRGQFSIMSKPFDSELLRIVEDLLEEMHPTVGEAEAVALWPLVAGFVADRKRHPSLKSGELSERELASAHAYMRSLNYAAAGHEARAIVDADTTGLIGGARGFGKPESERGPCNSSDFSSSRRGSRVVPVARGRVYVVQSASSDPRVRGLLKIGCTSGSVDVRTRAAGRDATFLGAGVRIIAEMPTMCDPLLVERSIHALLADQRCSIEFVDERGELRRPREWFRATLDDVRLAVSIVNEELLAA